MLFNSVRIFLVLSSIVRLIICATFKNATDDIKELDKHNNLPIFQYVNLSASSGWSSLVINSTNCQHCRKFTDNGWTTRKWVGFGLGVFGGIGLTLSAISNQCCNRNTLENCTWNCVAAYISVLALISGSILFTGRLNIVNQKKDENYISLQTIVDRFNANGMYIYDPVGNNYTETKLGSYTEDAWFQIRVPGHGLISNLFLSRSGSYVTAQGTSDHLEGECVNNRHYSNDHDLNMPSGAGNIKSHCSYNQSQLYLATPKYTNFIKSDIRDDQHISSPERYGLYNWITNDEDSENGWMDHDSNSLDNIKPKLTVSSECYDDHDEF
ncbi:hypothetical protein C6P45_002353 [Maudiozyma exigua]|uniref:Transmembrane protein n=1 Tax=Maudiozyma exigua TaxID=34358 RepID=A0A9P7BAS7_MAUEX|nr:hypothetical protein C6P45_002353 [Kazachstania exigua]